MTGKNITKKYLQERCTFKDKTVIIAVDFDGLYALVKQLDPNEQKNIFKVTEKTVNPLNENQIDSLLIYLPSEVKEGLDFIDMTTKEKLDLVRENKESLQTIIDKKGFNERLNLDAKKIIPSEEYSSALLWDIIRNKAGLN